MDTEALRILASLTAPERRLYRQLGGTVPRNLPLPNVEWACVDPKELRRQAQAKHDTAVKTARSRKARSRAGWVPKLKFKRRDAA